MARRPTPKPPPPKAPQEALRWFVTKVPFTRPEFDKLEEVARKRAFFVSNVTQFNLVSDVHKAIGKAIRNGTTLADFKKAVEAKLTREWGVAKPAVVETIFRNGVQSAYNAGRLEQFEDPLVKRFRPLRGWAVILDGRTTEHICRPLANLVVPANSSFAHTHNPPLHHRCRTSIMALSQEDAQEHGGGVRSPEHLPHVPPQEGFGGDPRVQPKITKLEEEPPALRREFRRKVEEPPPPPPPPEPASYGVTGSAAAVVEKEYPRVAKLFGSRLHVDGTTPAQLDALRAQLNNIATVTSHVLERVARFGVTVKIGPESVDELQPALSAVSVRRKGVGDRRTSWQQVGGVYTPAIKSVVVSTASKHAIQTDILAHELGHAHDHFAAASATPVTHGGSTLLWASHSPDFMAAWARFRGSTTALQVNTEYFTNASNGMTESYAETFNLLHTKGLEVAEKHFGPELPALVKKHMKAK